MTSRDTTLAHPNRALVKSDQDSASAQQPTRAAAQLKDETPSSMPDCLEEYTVRMAARVDVGAFRQYVLEALQRDTAA